MLRPFCDLMSAKDEKTVAVVLDGVHNILLAAEKLGETDKVRRHGVPEQSVGWQCSCRNAGLLTIVDLVDFQILVDQPLNHDDTKDMMYQLKFSFFLSCHHACLQVSLDNISVKYQQILLPYGSF